MTLTGVKTHMHKSMANVAVNIYGLHLLNASASDRVGLPNVVTLRGPALCQRSLHKTADDERHV